MGFKNMRAIDMYIHVYMNKARFRFMVPPLTLNEIKLCIKSLCILRSLT